MAIKYRKRSFPTYYKGRKYRSRLEARWAAFFDLVGWSVEYEPCDLGKWSPDFLLRNRRDGTGLFETDILIEIKPTAKRDLTVCRKMEVAFDAIGDFGLLLLGFAPWEADSVDYLEVGLGPPKLLTLGWIRESRSDPMDDCPAIWHDADAKDIDLSYGLGSTNLTFASWAEACNLVQWKFRLRPGLAAYRKARSRSKAANAAAVAIEPVTDS